MNRIFVFTAILSCIVGVIIFSYYFKSSCPQISCINIQDINKYQLKNKYEENKYIFRGLYEADKSLIRAEVRSDVTEEEARDAIQVQITRTKGLFEDAAAPYPGEISDVIACSSNYKPKYSTHTTKNGAKLSFFEGYINERLVFGSCVDDQAAYHDTFVMFYCSKQKKFYQIELIEPREKYLSDKIKSVEMLNSLSCRD